MTLGNKIRTLRLERGWSQPELAQKIGATKQRVWRYENDINAPVFEVLKKIAKVFNVSLDYLVFDEEQSANIKDKNLLHSFQIADKLAPQKKKLIKDMIKAVAESP
jgi:transcriptional regulator with XRE-family HTH domain